jgi:hypothetical protein
VIGSVLTVPTSELDAAVREAAGHAG